MPQYGIGRKIHVSASFNQHGCCRVAGVAGYFSTRRSRCCSRVCTGSFLSIKSCSRRPYDKRRFVCSRILENLIFFSFFSPRNFHLNFKPPCFNLAATYIQDLPPVQDTPEIQERPRSGSNATELEEKLKPIRMPKKIDF